VHSMPDKLVNPQQQISTDWQHQDFEPLDHLVHRNSDCSPQSDGMHSIDRASFRTSVLSQPEGEPEQLFSDSNLRPSRKVSCGKLFEDTKEITELRAQNESLRIKNMSLFKKEKDAALARQEALAGMASMEQVTQQLEAMRRRQMAGMEQLSAQLEVLQQQNESLSKEADDLRRMREEEASELAATIASLQGEIIELHQANHAPKPTPVPEQDSQWLLSRLTQLHDENQELRSAEDCARSEITSLQQANRLLKQETQGSREMAEANDLLTDRVAQLQADSQQCALLVDTLRGEIAELQKERTMLMKEIQLQHDQANASKHLVDELSQAHSQEQRLLEELERLRSENAELQQANETLRHHTNIHGELSEQNARLMDDVDQLQQEQMDIQKTNVRLMGDVTRLREERDRAANNLEAIQNENLKLRQEGTQLVHSRNLDSRNLEQSRSEVEIHKREISRLRRENSSMQEAQEDAVRSARELAALQEQHKSLLEEKDQLASRQPRVPGESTSRQLPEVSAMGTSSECRLSAVMADHLATPEQLRLAILAVESLVGEARRELANKQLRERRAAFERLHEAMDKGDENLLEDALCLARRAEVDSQDIMKGEAKLEELRSLTTEEREERILHELNIEKKKEAFLLVKKDDAESLRELLADGRLQWQEWRDYMGRTMWRYALELHAMKVRAVLAPHIESIEEAKSPSRGRALLAAANQVGGPAETGGSYEAPAAFCVREKPAAQETPAYAPSEKVVERKVTDQMLTELRTQAFRAVVKDDTASLSSVLEQLPVDMWSRWENKAGKDLLTLSQERGSSGAYSLLSKALGLLDEMKQEAFEERESVWIYPVGEVQPLRATVLEDTPEEAEDVLIEYWDGDQPPSRIEKCMVRKMWS